MGNGYKLTYCLLPKNGLWIVLSTLREMGTPAVFFVEQRLQDRSKLNKK